MTVLRDIVARLSLDLDKKSFREADLSIKGLTEKFAGLEGKIALAGIGYLGYKITDMASDAQEDLNVLNAAFQENTDTVTKWAGDFGTAAGRSEFMLRNMAGTFGAVLNPLMQGNAKAASEMSTRLSELAIDLGSFYNAGDKDALAALRSGLVGETEPLKRFGVVMTEDMLSAFALSRGIRQNVRDMSTAEKTALRYAFILDATKLAHGDAAKTSMGFANATKGLSAVILDLATYAGQYLLPGVEKIVNGAKSAGRWFLEFAKNSSILKAALVVLGAVAVAIMKSIVIASLPVIIPMLKLIALSVVATLVLNDLFALFDGSESHIGNFIDAVAGPGSAASAVDALKMAWEGFALYWEKEVIPGWQSLVSIFRATINDLGNWFSDLFTSIRGWINDFLKSFGTFYSFVKKNAKALADFLGIEFKVKQEKRKQDTQEDEYFKRQSYKQRQAEYKERVASVKTRIKNERKAKRDGEKTAGRDADAALKKTHNRLKKALRGRKQLYQDHEQQVVKYAVNIMFMGAKPTLANPFVKAGAGQGNVTINQNTSVNVAGNATAKDATTIAKTASASVKNQNRQALAALTQRAAG